MINKNLKNEISFIVEKKKILVLSPKGKITWFLNDKKIEITDKKLLCLALLDIVAQMSLKQYDYSLLDKNLWNKYQKFLETKESISNNLQMMARM